MAPGRNSVGSYKWLRKQIRDSGMCMHYSTEALYNELMQSLVYFIAAYSMNRYIEFYHTHSNAYHLSKKWVIKRSDMKKFIRYHKLSPGLAKEKYEMSLKFMAENIHKEAKKVQNEQAVPTQEPANNESKDVF